MTSPVPERIFHIATAADWRRTLGTGTYTTSTAGRTLDEEGFIHASRRDQVQGVFDRYYRSASEHLVLLTIDPTRLTDRATYVDPTRPSLGVVHLLVDGQFVVHDETLVADAFPGRPVRGVLD